MHQLAGIQKFSSRTRVFSKSIFKHIRGFLEKTSDSLSSTSVKVVPLIVSSTHVVNFEKVLQLSWAPAQKLSTARFARTGFFRKGWLSEFAPRGAN
jgi:hypothetical protein